MVFISGEQGNKGQILRGTKTILGNREHKKTNFRFLGNKGTGTPPPGRASIIVVPLIATLSRAQVFVS